MTLNPLYAEADTLARFVHQRKRQDTMNTATRQTEFTLTLDHLKLLQRMYVDWDDQAYEGAPAVGIKRPYGNSDVTNDVAEIVLGTGYRSSYFNVNDGDEEYDEDEDGDVAAYVNADRTRTLTVEQALALHRETATALQIVLAVGGFLPGTYRRTGQYDQRSWMLTGIDREGATAWQRFLLEREIGS